MKLSDEEIGLCNITLEDFIELWFKRHAEIKKAPSSICRDREITNHVLSLIQGSKYLTKIGINEFEYFFSKMIHELSGASCNRIRSFLHKLYNDAIKWRYAKYNPISAITRFHEIKKPPVFWTEDEIGCFLNYARGKKYYEIFKFALNTGMRQGEILGLQWDAIDLGKRIINVYRTYDNVLKEVKDYCKSKKYLCIGVNNTIFDLLIRLKQSKYPFIFHDGTGNIIPPREIQRVFAKYLLQGKIRKIRFHDLRHTYASHYMMNDGNLFDLKHILGHSDIKVTEIYAHLSKDHVSQKSNIVNFDEKPVLRVVCN